MKKRRFTTDNFHLFTVIKLNFADHCRYSYCCFIIITLFRILLCTNGSV